jgi:hypothetical protein
MNLRNSEGGCSGLIGRVSDEISPELTSMVLRLDLPAGSVDDNVDCDGIIITAVVTAITVTINGPVKCLAVTVQTMNNIILWDGRPCSLMELYQCLP